MAQKIDDKITGDSWDPQATWWIKPAWLGPCFWRFFLMIRRFQRNSLPQIRRDSKKPFNHSPIAAVVGGHAEDVWPRRWDLFSVRRRGGRESSLCLVVFSDFYASKNMGDLLIARFDAPERKYQQNGKPFQENVRLVQWMGPFPSMILGEF